MVAAPFEYALARSFAEAAAALDAYGEDARLLAGGQSLVPMLNLRLAYPSHLIDINPVGADGIEDRGDLLRIGALTRHRALIESEVIQRRCPVLAHAATFIGNVRVRSRGTIGGSLAHADPTAELPCVALALGAEVEALSARGTRRVPARDFFVSYLTTALSAGEVVTAVHVPALPPRTGWAFTEIVRRASDFAVISVTALVGLGGDGRVSSAALVLGGVADRPVAAEPAAAALRGQEPTEETLAGAAETAAADLRPESDVHASGAYRKRMASVLGRRALSTAVARARGSENGGAA